MRTWWGGEARHGTRMPPTGQGMAHGCPNDGHYKCYTLYWVHTHNFMETNPFAILGHDGKADGHRMGHRWASHGASVGIEES